MLKATVNRKQQAVFLLLLSRLTFLNQLGAADSIAVFNNSEKNEKILKVAIPPERLSGERGTAPQRNSSSLSSRPPGLLLQKEKRKKTLKTNK